MSGDLCDRSVGLAVRAQRHAWRDWCSRRRTPGPVPGRTRRRVREGGPPALWIAELASEHVTVDRCSRILGGWMIEAVPYGRWPRETGGICVINRPPQGSLCALDQSDGVQGEPGLQPVIAQGGAPAIILCGQVRRPHARQEVRRSWAAW